MGDDGPGVAKSKHRAVYLYLKTRIMSGEFPVGDQLPTEQELAKHFAVSRPTAARALNDLENDGFIERRAGAGSFVVDKLSGRSAMQVLGLLIPGLGDTEIFEPICGRIAAEAEKHHAVLLWGSGIDREENLHERMIQSARYFVEAKVQGVFFAPIEFDLNGGPDCSGLNLNRQIVDTLKLEGIPVVLLDRDLVEFPQRSEFDLVGLDHFRAGFSVARHLLEQGVNSLHFFARNGSAPTVRDRINGCRVAFQEAGLDTGITVHWGSPEDLNLVESAFRDVIGSSVSKAGIICANDMTAGQLMKSLASFGWSVPDDLLLASFDDVKYAGFLRPSLTTMAQPCDALGITAFNAMMTRIACPELPPRSIFLNGHLRVRESTGHLLA